MSEVVTEKTFAEKLMGVPSRVLYLILSIIIIISVFNSKPLPIQPTAQTADFYSILMKMPPGKVVVIESDFTNSTRGESAGQLEALVRILVRTGRKFIVFAGADPQAPTVSTDIIEKVIKAEEAATPGLKFKRQQDWIRVGNFPNLDNTARQFQSDFRSAFKGLNDQGQPVLSMPPFEGVNSINDLGLYVNVTASSTLDSLVGRLQFQEVTYDGKKVRSRLAAMVTGVIGPEAVNYYKSGLISGLVVGLNGTVELETLMSRGLISKKDKNDPDKVVIEGMSPTDKLPGISIGRGTQYYFALHTAMALLILAVIVGNVGAALQKIQGRSK